MILRMRFKGVIATALATAFLILAFLPYTANASSGSTSTKSYFWCGAAAMSYSESGPRQALLITVKIDFEWLPVCTTFVPPFAYLIGPGAQCATISYPGGSQSVCGGGGAVHTIYFGYSGRFPFTISASAGHGYDSLDAFLKDHWSMSLQVTS